jgi:hypothetical protein
MSDIETAYPAPNTGAVQVAVGIKLSGRGVQQGVGEGEFNLTLSGMAAGSTSVVITAQAIDARGNVLNTQPVITGQSTSGAPASGEGSVQTTYPNNCIGYQPGNTGTNNGQTLFGQPYQNSAIASVSAVNASGQCTVTLQNLGQCIVEFRTPQGFSARLNVSGVNQ